MFKTRFLAAAAAPLFLATALPAQPAPVPGITAEDLLRHIRILADDSYEGRLPGTAGGERTEAYLIEAFAEAGLKPGAPGDLWRQEVQAMERVPMRLTSRWNGVPIGTDNLMLLGREQTETFAKAPIVFAGHGAAEDLEGQRLDGAILLTLSRRPPPGKTRLSPEDLAARGVAAVVTIAAPDADWDKASAAWMDDQRLAVAGPAPASGLMSHAAAAQVFQSAGADLAALTERAADKAFRAVPLKARATIDVTTGIRRFPSANIIGKVEGTDPKGEAVVILSHWDHLGYCKPVNVPDRICNGAIDNASGTAILIETARRLAAGPRPERSIYFVATTGEEQGFWGADAFAANPPVEKDKIVAALNLDTTAIGPAGLPVAMVGRGSYPGIDAVVDATARALGRPVDSDTEANVMIMRQDGWALARRGIPTVMATGSVSDMNLLRAYLAGPYHQPNDDIPGVKELGGAVEDAMLHVALARALADPDRLPTP